MDFGSVLKRTWEIAWKYKGLWVLGILAGCSASGRGSGGNWTSSLRGYEFDDRGLRVPELEQFFRGAPPEEFFISFALVILCLFFILALVFLALGVIGQGGLIAGYARADEGEAVSLGSAFNLGLQHFWKLLGIRLIFWLAGVLVVIVLVLFILFTLGLGVILLCLLAIPLFLLGFLIDAYVILTMVAAVEDELDVFDAFRRSWEVVRDNLGPVFLMALILILGGGILGAIITLPFLSVALPGIVGIAIGTDQSIISGLLISGLCLAVGLPILIVINGLLTTFTTGGWTVTYRRLTGKAGVETLETAA